MLRFPLYSRLQIGLEVYVDAAKNDVLRFGIRMEQVGRYVFGIRNDRYPFFRRRYHKSYVRRDMKEFKAMAHINSLNGKLAEITVLENVGDNDYIVEYNGIKCHAIFNWFVCEYYADDVYEVVKE